MRKRKLFWRFLFASLLKRRSRIIISFMAVMVGTAVVAGLINFYYDVDAKMSREFRSYGANLVVLPQQGAVLSKQQRTAVEQIFRDREMIGSMPLLYEIVEALDSSIVLVGADLAQAPNIYPYWEVRGKWPEGTEQALLGVEAAEKMRVEPGDSLKVVDTEKRDFLLTVSGVVTSGDETDNQLIVDLGLAEEISGRLGEADVFYLSVLGQGQELARLAEEINAFSGMQAQPIRRISAAEGSIMEKITGLVALAVVIILILTGLCVSTTTLASVVERRKEIGLKKALGASRGDVIKEFFCEALVLGIAGGFTGWVLGFFVAQGLGYSVFQAPVALRWMTLPWTLLTAGAVAVAACWIPVKKAMSVDPAVVLRGE